MQQAPCVQHFEFLEVLGRGAYGVAHLARPRSGKYADLQVVKEVDLSELLPRARHQAWREARLLRSLNHANVVAHVATFMQESRLYIVMEYADGGDLAAAIRRRRDTGGKFPRTEVASVFAQCCRGLQHTHARHVLHRDLKAQNIFLTRTGAAKLGDFGIAKLLEHTAARAESLVGTPHYFAPELCEGQPYGLKADVWSLGVVLYELAALSPPFQASNLAMLALRILQSEPAPLPPEYAALQHVVQRVLRKAPAERPTCTELLALPTLAAAEQDPAEDPAEAVEELLESLERDLDGEESALGEPQEETQSIIEAAERLLGEKRPLQTRLSLPSRTEAAPRFASRRRHTDS